MSDTPPTSTGDQETDEYIESFVNALESRYPATATATPPEPATHDADQPDTEAAPSPTAPPEVPTEEPAEGGTPDEGEPPDTETRESAPAFTLSGIDYTPAQVTQAIQVHDWFAQLQPAQVQAIDALLSGAYRLEPAAPQTPPAGTAAATPSPPAPATEDEGEWLDPRAQQEIHQLRRQITELQQTFTQNLRPVVETQQQADYQARLAAINTAHASFQDKYGLDDQAMQTLEASIAEAQVLPALAHRHGNLEAGMNAALEMMFWTTPTYRDPYVQSRVTSQQAEQATEDASTVRKQHLTALSGSGGSVPRREPVPTTPEDRHAAMTAEIASAFNGSGQIE